eukprot:gene28293-31403_t
MNQEADLEAWHEVKRLDDGMCDNPGCCERGCKECTMPCGCPARSFCGKNCQKAHWKKHKEECGKRKAAASSPAAPSIGAYLPTTLSMPPEQNILVVGGFFLPVEKCFYAKVLLPRLQEQGIPYQTVNYNAPGELVALLNSGEFSACILLTFGSAGPHLMRKFDRPVLKGVLTNWVRCGGNLVVQGEGCMFTVTNDWFGMRWCMAGYSRNDLLLSRLGDSDCEVPAAVRESLPDTYSCKAVYMDGVAERCKLYIEETGLCAVAVSPVGLGRLSALGDVNAEESTIEVMIKLGLLF